jgi:Polyketide cyclase / dehydrase and lipid transport
MPQISITTRAETSAPPERVLAAAQDFSERRERLWPNVSTKRLEVHAEGDHSADVTEGSIVAGVWWERCRYDWSQPGVVTATVIDSNVYHQELSGFVWRARPRDGGSAVEMTVYRKFKLSPKGLAAAALYKLARSLWLGGMQRRVLRAIEGEPEDGEGRQSGAVLRCRSCLPPGAQDGAHRDEHEQERSSPSRQPGARISQGECGARPVL